MQSGACMKSLRIRLFGRISVEQDGQPLSDLPTKSLELLCYLFLYRDRAHSREALAALLWPDGSYTLSKKYLRQSLWRLQTTMGKIGRASCRERVFGLV